MKSFYSFFFILLLSALAFGQENGNDCLRCHSMQTLNKKDLETGKIKNLAVNPKEYAHSNHAGFECTDCHSEEFGEFPHPAKLSGEDIHCLDCHENSDDSSLVQFETIQESFEKSVHFMATDGEFTCFDCHDPHTFKLTARNIHDIKSTIKYDNQICFDCHDNTDKINLYTERTFPSLAVTHQWLPHQQLHWDNVRCIDCHTDPNQPGVSHLILPKEKAVSNCVECHSTNTRLAQTLYKFEVQETRKKDGFFNGVILNNSYIVGATRNYYLNLASFIIFGATFVVILLHFLFYLKAYNKKEHTHAEFIKQYFYPLWLRFWHWSNAILFLALIISGITLQYASENNVFLGFDDAITMHNAAGVLLSINYLLFFLGNLFSGNIKNYIPVLKAMFSRLFKQAKFYMSGIFKNEPHPFETTKDNKFNPLQQITYLFIMYVFVPITIITGWALLFPSIIIEDFLGESGLFGTAMLHTVSGFFLSLFMLGHIYLAITGHTLLSNLKAMVSGWHEVEKK